MPVSSLGHSHSITLFLKVCHCVLMSLQTVGRLHFTIGLQLEIITFDVRQRE